MATKEEQLLARLRFLVDQASLQQAEKAADAFEAKLKSGKKSAEEMNKELNAMRERAEKLQQVGTTLTIAGAAITAPLLLAAKQYRDAVGDGEEASARWAQASERLKDAQIRVGREATEALLPLMEQGADLAEKFADLLERNPDLVKGLLTVGGGLAAAGTVVTLIAQVQRLIATVQLLTATSAAGQAGGGGALLGKLGAAAASTGAAAAGIAAGGIAAGTAGYDALARASGRDSAALILQKYQTSLAYMWGKMLGGPELAAKWGQSMGELVGLFGKVDESSQAAAEGLSQVDDALGEQIEAYRDYLAESSQALAEFTAKRAQLIADAQAEDRQDYEDTVAQQMATVQAARRAEAAELQAYYANRAETIAQSNADALDAERDHQRAMQRLAEDSQEAIQDAVNQRDALGVLRAMRSAEKERRRAEEDYQAQVRQRNQQLADTLADMDATYAAQREQRLAQARQTLADDWAAYLERKDQRQSTLKDELSDLSKSYQEAARQRRQALNAQLQDTATALAQERQLKQQYTQAMLNDLKRAYQSALNQEGAALGAASGRETGGYLGPGVYQTHRREYLLNAPTTTAAERYVGSPLTAENLLAALAGSAGGTSTSLNVRADRRMTSEDRRELISDLEGLLGRVMK